MPELFDIKEVREYLDYSPETGLFFWIKKTSNRALVGAVAGCKEGNNGYIVIRLKGKLFRAHRLACAFMGIDIEGKHIDHIDGDASNNKISNLRPCLREENMRNLKPHSDNIYSKWKGVSLNPKTGKWYARIRVDGKSLWLGSFDDEKEAAEEYIFAALEHFGEYTRFA